MFTKVTSLILGATTLLTAPAVSIPPENLAPAEVLAPGSHPYLQSLDREVVKSGISKDYERTVTYQEATLSGLDRSLDLDPSFAVVRYALAADGGELQNGVEVWIKRSTGQRVIVPKSILRTAAMAASQEGLDLTLYSRAVEKIGSNYYVTYSLRPRRPDAALLDGSVTVTVDAGTGKRVGKLLR